MAKKIGSICTKQWPVAEIRGRGKVRSRGMLNKVQGMGVPVDELGISQVSMNLLDVSQCPLHLAFRTCESLASDHNTALCGSEVVGLVPLQAMLDAGRYFSPTATTDEALFLRQWKHLG